MQLKRNFKTEGKDVLVRPILAGWFCGAPEERRELPHYVKTAGDMLQTYWLHTLLLDSGYHFGWNKCQSEFCRWANLDKCVFGDFWKCDEHTLADLVETLSLYLPKRLAHLYHFSVA